MATVHIDDDTPTTREVVRETQVSDNGGTALTVLALLLVAIIAVGAYLYYNGSSRAPTLDRAVTTVEKGVSDAGDAVTKSTTTTTQQ